MSRGQRVALAAYEVQIKQEIAGDSREEENAEGEMGEDQGGIAQVRRTGTAKDLILLTMEYAIRVKVL